jgi:Protein of unknown function (DUF2889)
MTVGPTAANGTPAAGTTVHRRTLEYEVTDDGADLIVVGHLRDTRPWAEGTDSVSLVHDMTLRVRVRVEDMTIVDARADMEAFPHSECPGIGTVFAGLAGLRIGPGFTKAVVSLVGGTKGCTHLDQLARSLGPVVVQAVTSSRALAMSRGAGGDLRAGNGSPWARDSCHVWAADGVAERKLAAGWRPGEGPYPSLPAEWWEGKASAP